MAKLWILAVLAAVAFVKLTSARDVAEALNVNIREQLNLFDKLQKQAERVEYADYLKKLIEVTEGALKVETVEKKNEIIASQPKHFPEDFNKWISAKLEEAQVNADIQGAIEFYNSLLTSNAQHEAEITKTIAALENTLKETDLKQKEEKFLNFEKDFSPDFKKFLKENALPMVNRRLQKTVEFFDNLLNDKESQYAKEIGDLKAKTEAALGSDVSIDEKNKVLQEVTFTKDEQLNQYLHKKNIEYS